MSEPTEQQIIAGARAVDRYGLRQQGWSETEIEAAMSAVRQPSKIGIETARVVLSAAMTPSRPHPMKET